MRMKPVKPTSKPGEDDCQYGERLLKYDRECARYRAAIEDAIILILINTDLTVREAMSILSSTSDRIDGQLDRKPFTDAAEWLNL